MIRRACRVDANHGNVVNALRMVGCNVQDLSKVGEGCPDLLIGIPTVRELAELETRALVKCATQPNGRRIWGMP